MHRKVVDALDPKIGNKLTALRKRRNDADYEPEIEFEIGMLKWACQVAERLISELRQDVRS